MQRNHRRSRALALLLLFALIAGLTAALSLLFTATRIQADDTGWHSPGSDNATGAGTGGDGFEINPVYAYSDDNLTAQNNGGLGDSHLFYDFGLPVPPDATVKGVQVRLDWYLDSDNGTSSMGAELSWDGGSNWTSPFTDNVESTAERTAYLGGSSDGWGRSWTPSEFTNNNFRVRITCNSDTAGKVFYLEYISVIVYYAPVHHLEVIGDGAMTAGGSNALTIRAWDTFGDIAVNYNGLKSLTFSGPGQAPAGQIPTVGASSIGTPVSVTFTNGVSDNATATTLVAYKSETTTVQVSDGTFDSYTNGSYGLSLTVNPGALHHIITSPDTSTITAGNAQSYATQSFDQFDNLIADVTSSTAFSIEAGAGGSWATNVYTSATAGTWIVTGTYTGFSDTASLKVNAGPLHHIVISPDSATVTAGNTQTYTAEAFDQFNNTLGDVTSSTAFSIEAGAGGSWATNVYTSQTAGTWTVTGTYSALTDTASLTVNAGALHHIVVSPDTSTVTASNTQAYSAQSFDQFDNLIADVTASTAFSIDAGAGGSWAANVYTSASAGTWTVTGSYVGLTDAASLTVNAGPPHHIVISPDANTITAGSTQTYTAEAFDQANNTLGDVTTSTVFSIDVGAGGSWAANVYTSEKAGTWTVSGTYGAITDNANLTVNAGPLHHIVISPDSATIVAGNSQAYTAQSFDQFDNTLGDVTGSTTFSITLGAGGSWAANVYTSASAGTWTVTGSYSGFTDTASLTVSPGPLHHIVISPDTATITAGNSQAYSAQCMDQFDNLIADVTGSTAFSIDAGAGGSWAANVYTSASTGTWTVTGTYLGLTDTASLTVSAGSLHHIVISPDTSTVNAGGTQTYTAEAFDQSNNTLGDVTSSTTFSITPGAGGSWAANVYTSEKAGAWIVTGTYSAITDTASLTVNAGALDHIVISPDSTTIVAGNTQVYSAQSFDQFNNPIADVTASTVFSIDAGAGGSWAANIYTSQTVGPWTVTGTHLATYSDTASLTVNPGALHHIVISPDTATIIAGNYQDYTARSFDQFDNLIADVSSSTVFSITPAAGGGWNGIRYTSAIAGTWTVTGTYIGFTDTASLTVNPGPLHHIVISPDSATITAGNSQAYSAQSFDQFSNLIADVTATTAFSITPAASGSWAANVYTSASAGTWTVTGTYSTVSDTASLTVNAAALDHIVISPATSTITARGTQAYTAQSFDQFNNPIADVTSSTSFSIDAGAGGTWAANIYTSLFAGTWTVTGTYLTYSDTATLTVNAGLLHHIVISPSANTITAGNTQAYTAEAFDTDNNTLGDVTAFTVFSITPAAGGIWAANVYTSAKAGTWTVTGTYSGVPATATLTVNTGPLHHIVVSPDANTITAGSTQTYTAEAFDVGDNSLGDVTSSTAFSIIEAGAGGSWLANAYTSEKAGLWTVTGTYLITYSDTASLTVNAGPLHHIVISPDSAIIIAGNPQTYTAEAFDQFNNTLGSVSGSTVFSIDAAAGGSWAANVYTSAKAGTWTVTGTYTGFTDTASLTVNVGPLHHIVVSPDSATVTAGNAQPYTAQSFDQFDNPIADITGTTSFAIDAAAGGSWIANVYFSAKAGTWTVTGNYGGLIDTAGLTVNAGPLHHIVISPDSATVTAGNPQTYTAQSFDQFDNSIADITTSTGFSIDVAAGGTWSANVYTSAKAGTWTVTGTYSAVSDTASLTVNVGPLHHIIVSPDGATIIAGNSQTYTAQTADQFDNPIADVTGSTVFSIDFGAGGTWAANVYTSAKAGTWTVAGDYSGLIGTAILNVTAASVSYIIILPDGVAITAGDSQTYTAQSFDQFDNLVADVTDSTVFSIDIGAGGTWVTNVYTSAKAGTWTVTGTCLGLTDTAGLVVSAGALHHIVISPDSATITAGSTQAYTALSLDQFDNPISDITSGTAFSIAASAGGSWAANVYTSRTAGTWTVTGTYTTFSDTASLTVNPGAVDHYTVTSDDYVQQVTIPFTVTVTAYDAYGNLVTASGTAVTVTSSSSGLVFDGNDNGTYDQIGDDTGILTAGTFDIRAKAKSPADGLIITVIDTNARTGYSEPYTIEDFRCFIATAAYGTPMIDQIQVLRDFRDQYLMKNPAGRWFVSNYYRYSPPLARFIAHHDSLRALVRFVLTPIIWLTTLFMNTTLLQKMAFLASILALVAVAVLWLRKPRKSPTL
jgi:hypothetical protein